MIAIVPAHNEALRIGRVLSILTSYQGFEEVVVVDDGSRDGTAEEARRFPVRVVSHAENRGKGAALESGVSSCAAETLFFCDADIIEGLTHELIKCVAGPVERGELDMFVASRERARYSALRFALINTPLLDGQRALTRALWDRVPAGFKQGFEIETALNHFAQRSAKGMGTRVFPELRQARKEEKYGMISGRLRRISMYSQIVRANLSLQTYA